MRPEDLVGRRIRFLPFTKRCVYGKHLECLEAVVVAAKPFNDDAYSLHIEPYSHRPHRPEWQQGIRLGRDFIVVEGVEIPYSWRN
jgi:hypothetical protein